MIRHHVRSADWSEIVFADTREEAAVKALKLNTWGPPRSMPDYFVTVEDDVGSAQFRVATGKDMSGEWLIEASLRGG